MKTTSTTSNTLSVAEERPPLREIMKILGMKELTANVFTIPTKKKVS